MIFIQFAIILAKSPQLSSLGARTHAWRDNSFEWLATGHAPDSSPLLARQQPVRRGLSASPPPQTAVNSSINNKDILCLQSDLSAESQSIQ